MLIYTAKGHGGARIWYSRRQNGNGFRSRSYHVFGLNRVVSAKRGSFWKLIIFRWCFVFGYKSNRRVQANNEEQNEAQ